MKILFLSKYTTAILSFFLKWNLGLALVARAIAESSQNLVVSRLGSNLAPMSSLYKDV